ncbi:MAG: succinylglutamate desuccinylase [Saprospiraceae bacterium]|jgi:succinylglutamate desuccinylase|tara:strand:- start:1561 stop:2499 length:939 start_codon:yes stop_codon:yes gene_type:complete
MVQNRVITKYIGVKPGPLLIVLGGMHGNEPAGIKAIEMMGKMLEVEPITNLDFEYSGSFLGLIGNLKAHQENKRFINSDLNRSFTKESLKIVEETNEADLKDELLEIKQILREVHQAIDEIKPEKVIVLDLHTTSSFGGIFSIVADNEESLKIAIELHAPVIMGMLDGIKGTTLHYFIEENFGVPMVPVTFESGQHNEELSVNRAIAGITNCMRTIGSVSPEHVENQHDILLIEHSKDLPKVSRLVSKHHISDGDHFRMLPNYKNFQRIKEGEVLAKDIKGDILASDDSLILMPLYQKLGEDGFFLIQKIDY